MAMLEGVEGLTLKRLNDATVAWLEQDYHPPQAPRARHDAS